MPGPWEEYQQPSGVAGPWQDYGPPPERPSALSQIGTSLKNQVKGIFDTLSTLVDPIAAEKAGNGIIGAQVDQWHQAKQEYAKGNYGGALTRALGAAVPILGPLINNASEKATTGGRPYEAATDLAAAPLIAEGIRASLPVADAALNLTSRGAEATSRGLMKSALKPGVADAPTLADVRQATSAALENQIPVSEAGAAKLSDLIADFGKKTQAVVDARTRQGARVDPNAVAARLNDVNTTSALPEKATAAVEKARQAFLARKGVAPAGPPTPTGLLDANGQPIMRPGTPANPGNPIPLDVAQAEKQGSYQNAKNSYGELSEAQVEAEKALARGYKEEIEAQAPELKALNAKESEFLALQPALERAVRRAGNQDVTDFKSLASGGAGMAAAGPAGAVAGLTTRVLDFPGVKSRLAIAINKASQRTGTPLTMSQSTARAAAILSRIAAGSQTSPSETGDQQ